MHSRFLMLLREEKFLEAAKLMEPEVNDWVPDATTKMRGPNDYFADSLDVVVRELGAVLEHERLVEKPEGRGLASCFNREDPSESEDSEVIDEHSRVEFAYLGVGYIRTLTIGSRLYGFCVAVSENAERGLGRFQSFQEAISRIPKYSS